MPVGLMTCSGRMMLSGAIPPALLDALLPGKGVLRFVLGNHADLSGAGDAASLPHETPLPEKIGLHVEPVEPARVPGRINAMDGNGAHVLSLEIVASPTL